VHKYVGSKQETSWNEQIQDVISDAIGEAFNLFEDSLGPIENELISSTRRLFDQLETRLEGELNSSGRRFSC
jgi:hypothetical protein